MRVFQDSIGYALHEDVGADDVRSCGAKLEVL